MGQARTAVTHSNWEWEEGLQIGKQRTEWQRENAVERGGLREGHGRAIA